MLGITSLRCAFQRTTGPLPLNAHRFMAAVSTTATKSVSTVPLAYDLHVPAKPVSDEKTSPIIVMHGLFGSKKNNRTISK
jgi:hypothetical protein